LSGIVTEETMQAFKQELLHRSLRWAQVPTMFFFILSPCLALP
jgi:hypothetical protein